MDEENSGTPQQDPNAKASADTSTTTTSGAIVDKTLSEIASGVVKDVGTDAKATVDTEVAKVETKVETKAHGILDELEAHLSQFDARAVAIYHSFLQRLRNAV